MPEIKLFYRNCNCCSGSGSSGSGSGGACDCLFLTDGFDSPMRCNGFPVVTECKKDFVVNITLSFSGCGSSPLGSCGSGSGGGPTTGGDFEPTGSGSDCTVCPDCCDLIPRTFQLGLECVGDTLASSNLIDGNCGSTTDLETGSTCVGPRPDKCTYFWIQVTGSSFSGEFFFPLDNWGLAGVVNTWNIDSCDPFQMSGTLNFNRAGAPLFEPCLAACLGRDPGVWLGLGSGYDPSCITGSFVITES